MRIALVTREYPPETAWGGIGKFYGTFAQALRMGGHDVEVFTQGITSEGVFLAGGITVHRVMPRKWIVGPKPGGDLAGMDSRGLGAFALSLSVEFALAVMRRHAEVPFDVIEGHEHLGVNAFLAWLNPRACLHVTRYQTAYHTLVSRGLANWPRFRIIERLESMSIRKAHVRISSSAFIESVTREDFPGAPPCDAVIPLLSPRPASAVPPLEGREKLMVFVGRMMPGHKNPDMAARCFAALAAEFPDWRIEFAGLDIDLEPGVTGWSQCREILAPWPDRFHYHGVIGPDAVAALYGRARIAILPSKFESFGLVALEAMAAGCVPVVANRTALEEIVESGGVIFDNGSMDDLIRKVRPLLAGDQLRVSIGGRALARSQSEFSQAELLERNLELFRR